MKHVAHRPVAFARTRYALPAVLLPRCVPVAATLDDTYAHRASSSTPSHTRPISQTPSHGHVPLRYANKGVIVTGGSRGIGAGISSVFVREGAHVLFCTLPTHSAQGHRLAEELNAKGPGKAFVVEADLTQPGAVHQVVAAAVEHLGRIDCLVNNAGWHPPATSIDDMSEGGFRKLLELNLVAPWLLCQQALPHLRTSKGAIINIGSLSGHFGQVGSSSYCATKAALVGLSRALAIDEAQHDVRVNTVSPGEKSAPHQQPSCIIVAGYPVLELLILPHVIQTETLFSLSLFSQATCGLRCGRSTWRGTPPRRRSRRGRTPSCWAAWAPFRRWGPTPRYSYLLLGYPSHPPSLSPYTPSSLHVPPTHPPTHPPFPAGGGGSAAPRGEPLHDRH